MEQTPATNANPLLSVDKNRCVLYSNEAGITLLNEWGVKIGEKLPSTIGDLVQRVLSLNSPEKTEVKVGNRIYLVIFSPLPEQECVNISGFDISDQKEVEEHPLKANEQIQTQSEELILSNRDLKVQSYELNEANTLLHDSVLGFRTFAENSPDLISRFDRQDRCIYANPAAILFDIPLIELMKLSEKLRKNAFSTGKSEAMVLHYTSPKGKKYCFDTKVLPEFVNNEVVSIFVISSDITNLKEAEATLRSSNLYNRSLIEASLDPLVIIGIDGNVTDVNKATEQVTGYSRNDLIGTYFAQYLTEPDHAISAFIHVCTYGELRDCALEIKHRDGHITPVLCNASVYRDENGKVIGVFVAARDITELKRVEEELVFERSQLLSIFDGMDDVVYVTDPYTFEVLYANKGMKEKFGGELVGGTCYKEFQRKDSPCDFCTNSIILKEKGKPYHWEYYNPMVDRFFMIMDRIIKWPDGRDVRLEIAKDITERKHLEEQTRQRIEELETLMDVVPVAIFIGYDPECNKITGNKMANELYEAKQGENVSANVTHIRRIFHKGIELTSDKLPMQKAADEDIDVLSEELEWLLPSGERRSVLGSASPLHDAEGNVRGSIGAFIDITERKQLEEALNKAHDTLEEKVKERTTELEAAYNSLKESKERLAEAQKMAHVGSWDWDIETDIAYWSNELYNIFGLDPQELAPTYNEYLNYVHPDDREYADNAHKEALNGKPFSMDHKIILPNGEERIIHLKTEVIFNENNIPIRLKGTVQDITERKRSEEKLRESEEKYRNIVETANEGIALVNSEGIITYVNKKMADMLGYTIGEIIGAYTWDFVEDKSTAIILLENKRRGLANSIEIKQIRKDGLPLWVYINSKPIFDNNGKFMGSLGMFTDITERKKAEEAIVKIEISRKQEIHHRIKNNLQVISSLIDLQSEKFKGKKNIEGSEVLEAFKESQDRVISMALIHEELHKGGKIDTLNFSHYIEELADNLLLTYRLGNEGIILFTDIEEDIFFDMDTAVPLGIIVNELLSNSLKYAFPDRENGEIQIKLHRENGECKIEGNESTNYVLSVSDNGIGIPEDIDIADIDSLGLQLITTLVEQLDGELELKRNNGTEFIIRFTVTGNSDQELTKDQLKIANND